ncbi:alpha/beta hydrolase [Bacillus sp. S/N-304-OC-R1]|uniref:alpha/beta hydrolase n=1 Tax=Bacillus sp. S/N-304-OC-R1 TaxID=2758034 RepID=UPI001C8DD83B|nr:alpha/beta hydrolase [Bacillus sp. S/N-304-OC-R1]MBY0122032.1 alpha/beta fold hydrolase [Bacillus sp. S/N-304-OC-R1]
MKEQSIQFETDIIIKGTVNYPEIFEGKLPLVVILHGSGPIDRDGNVKNFSMNAYRMLAEFFASFGVATLRYDKRGSGESGGDFYETGMWDLVNDGVAAVQAARQLPEVDPERVFLLGHSEGCTVGPAVNKRVQAAGIIFLAGQADNVRKASEFQTHLVEKEAAGMKGFQGFLLRALKVHTTTVNKQAKLFQEILTSNQTVYKKGVVKINAKWMREIFEYNMTPDLEAITCPIIAITGDKDVQVDPTHVQVFAEKVNGPAEGYNVVKMNHLLRDQEEPVSSIKVKTIYKKGLTNPLSHEMLTLIKQWSEKYMLAK